MYQEATMHASLLHALLESGGPYRLMHVHSICMFTNPARQTFITVTSHFAAHLYRGIYNNRKYGNVFQRVHPHYLFLSCFSEGQVLAAISLQAL